MFKIQKISIVISIIIFLSYDAFAQSITWERTYDNPSTAFADECNAICLSDSGNFFLVGYTFLSIPMNHNRIWVIKINSYGDTLWTKLIGRMGYQGSAVVSTDDGGCVITGRSAEAFTIKIDKDGKVVWEHYYGGSGVQSSSIIETSDGGFLACGRINLHDGYSFKVDANGIFQWDKIFPSLDYKFLSSVIEKKDFYYFIGSSSESQFDTLSAIFIKTSLVGTVQCEKRIKIQNRSTSASKIIGLNDSTILISGSTSNIQATVGLLFFASIDSCGKLITEKVFESKYTELFSDLSVAGGTLIFSSSLDSGKFLQGKAFVTDLLGNVLLSKVFNTKYDVELRNQIVLPNKDIIFVGTANFNLPNADLVCYAVRTDSALSYKTVKVLNENVNLSSEFELLQNYPNPFNPTTQIRFEVAKQGFVSINIYNVNGRRIHSFVNKMLSPGTYEIQFDGFSQDGKVPSGIYFYELVIDNQFMMAKKMILIN